jgi:hypothetical protein
MADRLIAAPHKFSCSLEPNGLAAVLGVQSIGWSRGLRLFSREKPKTRSAVEEADQDPLDPIALCLALWLGMMVCAFGFARLMDDAAQRTENASHPAIEKPALYPAGLAS